MEIITQRLICKKFKSKDLQDYCLTAMNEDVMQHITGIALTKIGARDRFREILKLNKQHDTAGFYSIKRKDDQKFVGLIKIEKLLKAGTLEIGYALLPEFWGQKFATEIVKTLINYFTETFDIIELHAFVSPNNEASKRVLTNNGFEHYRSGMLKNRQTEFYKLDVQKQSS